MRDNGFTVKDEFVQDISTIKAKYQIPPALQSCHTAIVDGYVIEGHVPLAEINRLLVERPTAIGLAVAGMPVGAPGMEVAGAAPQAYDVVLFDATGRMEIYGSYP